MPMCMKPLSLIRVLAFAAQLLLLASSPLLAQSLTVTVTSTTNTQEKATNQANLEQALHAAGIYLWDIATIEITAGRIQAADWNYFRANRDALSNLKSFTVSDGASEVDAILPSTFAGLKALTSVSIAKVTGVGSTAFSRCSALRTVTLPAATGIGERAFSSCTSLRKVEFPAAKDIGESAFLTCTSLQTVEFRAATNIGGQAFYSCPALQTVILPAATSIGQMAFFSCAALQTVELPAATSIGWFAFSGCIALQKATLPVATSIVSSAFSDCRALVTLALGATPPTVGDDAFAGCPPARVLTFVDAAGNKLTGTALDNARKAYRDADDGSKGDDFWYGWAIVDNPTLSDLTVTVTSTANVQKKATDQANLQIAIESTGIAPKDIATIEIAAGRIQTPDWNYLGYLQEELSNLKSFTITEGVSTVAPIPPNTFADLKALTNVSIARIAEVGSFIFSGCATLQTVTLPAATGIGESAFSGCKSLQTVSLPAATSIGESAFSNCAALQTVSLPVAESIGKSAFSGCAALQTVTYPKATSIGQQAFYRCKALQTVSLPAATSIGSNAFTGCSTLKTVSLPAATGIGEKLFSSCKNLQTVTLPAATSIGNSAFSYCSALQEIELPSVKSIGESVFSGCAALQTVTLPVAESIGSSAFSNCTTLQTVSFPAATSIGKSAFSYCTTLQTVALPAATSIGEDAFIGCRALATLALGATPPTAGDNAFYTCSPIRALTFVDAAGNKLTGTDLDNARNAYRDADDGSKGDDFWYGWAIVPLESGELTVTVTSTANVQQKATDQPNLQIAIESTGIDLKDIATIEITAGRIQTPDWNYLGYHSEELSNLKSFTITEGVSTVAPTQPNTLSRLKTLANVSIAKVAEVGNLTFSRCAALQTVSLPAATYIGEKAFYSCPALQTVSLLAATDIGESAFSGCAALRTVSLSVATSIGNGAFSGCAALREIELSSVKSIGSSAFSGCKFLQTVSLSAATSIGESAFYGCEFLQTASLPVATRIGGNAFSGCSTLKTVSIPAATGIGEKAFYDCESLQTVSLLAATDIGESAFSGCESLQTVSLPAATSIGKSAFIYCTTLQTVSLPAATSIENNAFTGCRALGTLALGATPPTVEDNAFYACSPTRALTFVDAAGNKLTGADLDNARKAYRDADDGTVGDDFWYGWAIVDNPTLSNLTVTVTTTANVQQRATDQPNLQIAIESTGIALEDIAGIVITAGHVQAPDWNCLRSDFLSSLKSFTVSDGISKVDAIQQSSFAYFHSLTDVYIAKVAGVGSNAFFRCPALQTVSLPVAESIGRAAFSGCKALQTVSLPAAESIGKSAFYDCRSLQTVSLPAATSIGESAFSACKALQTVTYPKAKSIGEMAFSNCSALASLALGATPPTVGDKAFADCPPDRVLTFVDAAGNELTGAALDNARKVYRDVDDGNKGDDFWYGWAIPSYPVFTVTFIAYDGAAPATKEVDAGTSLGEGNMPSAPTRDGYDFKGWASTSGATVPDFTAATIVNGNMTVYGVWEQKAPVRYTVTFIAYDGAAPLVKEITTESFPAADMPPAPIRPGYEFMGWTTTAGSAIPDFKVGFSLKGDLTVYGLWKNEGPGTPVQSALLAEVRLAPNPVVDILTVQGTQHATSLELYTLAGQQLLHYAVQQDASEVRVDMRPYPTGVYLLRLVDGAGAPCVVRVVKL